MPKTMIDPKLYRPAEVEYLKGAPDAVELLGWKPKVTFEELVKLMVEYDIDESQKLE